MDYCACGRTATGRCVACVQPCCDGCKDRRYAAQAAAAARSGIARVEVLCRPCGTRELEALHTARLNRITAADPHHARLLALHAHVEAGPPRRFGRDPQGDHWPLFEESRAAGVPFSAGSAHLELLAMIRAGLVLPRQNRLSVFACARVNPRFGAPRTELHPLGDLGVTLMRVPLSDSETDPGVSLALRADGCLVASFRWPRHRYFRILTTTDGSTPAPVSWDGDYMFNSVTVKEARRMTAEAAAEMDRVRQAPAASYEFDRLVPDHPETRAYAEHSLAHALWGVIDRERTPGLPTGAWS